MCSNSKTGAACPRCNTHYVWDWCQDSYKTLDGKFCNLHTIAIPEEERPRLNDAEEVQIHQCPCGEVLLVALDDLFINNKAWKDIDWEDEKYAS